MDVIRVGPIFVMKARDVQWDGMLHTAWHAAPLEPIVLPVGGRHSWLGHGLLWSQTVETISCTPAKSVWIYQAILTENSYQECTGWFSPEWSPTISRKRKGLDRFKFPVGVNPMSRYCQIGIKCSRGGLHRM